ncbi:uncharacterized protein LOC131663183 isoform X2 [Phymastichus coffea]|uniref:uncharacterized protein LOC131663183 isoform X2 n=1 Tax=Phymastichus coffea TaxID=108790 RepID=UPI00273C9587|nr:uncharacterized protein LOC131663183 isoform X2 [Phymastichus coffea]
MVSSPKMTPLMAFFLLVPAIYGSETDQQTSESQHDQVAILKQIRKVNDDGSYTYGYEAGDGSFKEHVSVAQNIPRNNRTSTTRRPTAVYASSTESSTKSTVVQPIPRTRKTTTIPTTSSTTGSNTESVTRPNFIRQKGRPRFIINGQQRPLVLEEEAIIDENSPSTKTNTGDKASALRKVVFTKRPLDQSLRPITEEFEDKEEETKITTGNSLRRQLQDETTKATPVVEQEDDHADVYGGALSTSRPLFTTTTPPRVIQRLSGLQQERQKNVYSNQEKGPATFEQPRAYEQQESKTSTQEDRNPAQQVLFRTATKAPTETREFVRQAVDPLYVRQQQEAYLREVQPGGLLVQGPSNNLEEDPAYRQVPLSRLLSRPDLGRLLPNQQLLYSGATDANVHYLTDSPPAALEQEEASPRIPPNPIHPAYLTRQRLGYQRQVAYPEGLADPRRPLLRQVPIPGPVPGPLPGPISGPVPRTVLSQDEREYQNLNIDYPYRSHLALPPEPPNPIAPPLSRRDFQILLRRLLVSQYGIQALNYPRTYLEDALYDQQPYPSYQPGLQAPVPRGEVPYPPEPGLPIGPGAPVGPTGSVVPGGPVPPGAPIGPGGQIAPLPPYPERVALRRAHVYSQALNPLYQTAGYEDYPEARYSKRVYRQKYYTPEVLSEEGEEILPPQIREALLLRMLQLAINAERPIAVPNNMIMTTALPMNSRYRKSGPVRSVQILGEDMEQEKETRKKM